MPVGGKKEIVYFGRVTQRIYNNSRRLSFTPYYSQQQQETETGFLAKRAHDGSRIANQGIYLILNEITRYVSLKRNFVTHYYVSSRSSWLQQYFDGLRTRKASYKTGLKYLKL